MGNVTEVARRIRAGEKKDRLRCEVGSVAQTAPLTVSLLGGELMAAAPLLRMTAAAAERTYQKGDEVLCLLHTNSVMLLDKVVSR